MTTRPNSAVLLNTEVKLVGIATCRHEATNARVVVSVYAKGFTLNAYGTRRVNSEAAYRTAKAAREEGENAPALKATFNGSVTVIEEEVKPLIPVVKAPGRKLKTSDFLRQLKAAHSSGELPFVASTIMALGSASAMAL